MQSMDTFWIAVMYPKRNVLILEHEPPFLWDGRRFWTGLPEVWDLMPMEILRRLLRGSVPEPREVAMLRCPFFGPHDDLISSPFFTPGIALALKLFSVASGIRYPPRDMEVLGWGEEGPTSPEWIWREPSISPIYVDLLLRSCLLPVKVRIHFKLESNGILSSFGADLL